jgi:flagellar biosynthetic protein FliQ
LGYEVATRGPWSAIRHETLALRATPRRDGTTTETLSPRRRRGKAKGRRAKRVTRVGVGPHAHQEKQTNMPEALVVGTVRQAIETAIWVSLPMLAAGLIAGVLVSILQTVTSIQDNVLAFIPRATAIFVAFALTFPWMLRVVTGFSRELIARLPELIR